MDSQQDNYPIFETPKFMEEWTDKQKAEFAFQLLISLPTHEALQVVDRISPYLHHDILLQLPYEIALHILGYLDVYSLSQASQVSRGWYALCEEQILWRDLYEGHGWSYNQDEINTYLANVPPEENYDANSSNYSSSNNGSTQQKNSDDNKITPVPIMRSSSPLINKAKWSKLHNLKNRLATPASSSTAPLNNDQSLDEAAIIKRTNNFILSKYKKNANQHTGHLQDHYEPISDMRYINWKKLYENRLMIEKRWISGSCHTRVFPPSTCPVSDLHTEGIYCIQFDKERMITGSRDQSVKIWDIETGKCKITLSGHTGSVLCLQYDHDTIVSGSSDTTLIVAELETGKIKQKLLGHQDSVLNLRLINKDKVISCSKDRTLRLWDKHSGKCIRVFDGHRAAVNAVQWSKNTIVSASGDRTIKIWNLETGECLKTLAEHTRGVACIEFDGQRIVSGSSDQTIKVWNAHSGECIYTLVGHTELVRTIQLDPIADRIISGCYDGRLKIWDLKEKRLLRDLGQATGGRILNLKFDCTKIACCSNMVKIVIYDFAHGVDTRFLI